MNPAEIDALVASVQANAAPGQSAGTPTGTPIAASPVMNAGATAQAPQLTDFIHPSLGNSEVSIDVLLDLTLPVAIELGRTNMTVQEILRLGRGSVIQLDRLAGEPVDIFVADRKFAEGEVVVLGEHFGIRITQILAAKQNVASAA